MKHILNRIGEFDVPIQLYIYNNFGSSNQKHASKCGVYYFRKINLARQLLPNFSILSDICTFKLLRNL